MNKANSTSLKDKTAGTEGILNHVNMALKCLNLYPANHEITRSAIDRLWIELSAHLTKCGQLDVYIMADKLLVGGRPIGLNSPEIKSLALKLYRLKLDRLLMIGGMGKGQLLDLLMIFCMAPNDVFQAGGVRELLWQKGADNVIVSQAALKLNYEVETENDSIDSVKVDQIALAARKALISETKLTERERLIVKMQLELDAPQLAIFLQTLKEDTASDSFLPVLLEIALPKIDLLIQRELSDEKAFLYRNLAEAILLFKEPLRTMLATRLFSACAAENRKIIEQEALILQEGALRTGFASTLLEQFSDVEMAELKGRPVDKKPSLRIEPSRLSPDIDPAPEVSDYRTEPVARIDAAKIASLAMSINPNRVSRLEREISQLNESTSSTHALNVLAELLDSMTKPIEIAEISQAIQRIFNNALQLNDFDLAASALAVISTESKKRTLEPDSRSIFKEIIRDAGKKERIENLLGCLERRRASIKQAVDYLEPLENAGIQTLLDILAVEDRQNRRRLVCRLLTAYGKTGIARIGDKIHDHRWYLVRNVVLVLGAIGDESAARYLKKAAGHPDARVRMEAAKALCRIGPSALSTVVGLLRDADISVQLEAIRSISKINSPDTVGILIELIKRPDFWGNRVDLKLEAIRALSLIKTDKTVRYLSKLARSRVAFCQPSQTKLKIAAKNALLSMEVASVN